MVYRLFRRRTGLHEGVILRLHRGFNGQHCRYIPYQHLHSPGRDPKFGLPEHLNEQPDIFEQLFRRCLLPSVVRGGCTIQEISQMLFKGTTFACITLIPAILQIHRRVSHHGQLLFVRKVVPIRNMNQKCEPIRQRRIQWLRSLIHIATPLHKRKRIHGSPSVAQFRNRDTVHSPLMNDGEELILRLRLASVELIDKHRLGLPYGCRRRQKSNTGTVRLRMRKSNEIVERDLAGVIMPMVQPKRFRQPIQQKRFPGSRLPNQKQWIFRDERCQNDRFDRLVAKQSQALQHTDSMG